MADSSHNAHAHPAETDHLLDQVEHLAGQVEHVQEGLQRSHRLATLGTIATIIAHEYNNILTPIMSYAQMALANPDDPALLRKAVEKAYQGSERAARISSSLLGFARGEEDQAPAAHLPTTIQETLTCLGRDLSKDGIELLLDPPDASVAMRPIALQQVLMNLLLNARKALRPTGGRVDIWGEADGELVHLRIRDTGPGIPEAIRERLFDPFVCHEPPPPEDSPAGELPKGTGLGLSICRELVEQAGGGIEAENPPEGGAAFHLRLPVADESPATPQ